MPTEPSERMKAKSHTFAVLTADIMRSRDIQDFPTERDRKLDPLAKSQVKRHLIFSKYAVTAWDEFQGVLSDLVNIPEVVLEIRRFFYPMHLRIGIGIGEVSNPVKQPVNVFAGGLAFERARQAIKSLDAERSTLARSTLIVSDNDEFDYIVNTIYHLNDTLLDQMTRKQWETMNIRLSAKSQDSTAHTLGLDKSSVSRRLKRGSYGQIVSARDVIKVIIAHYWKQRIPRIRGK